MTQTADLLQRRLRKQARSCAALGSDLYAHLLECAADDAAAGGVVADLLGPHAHDPPGSALALRLMGSVHRLVLERKAPELALFYPSVGGAGAPQGAWGAFRKVLDEHSAALAQLLPRTVQTNEIGRSAGLIGGFLEVARATGYPLEILEIGSSAGLNLRWDHFRYACGAQVWGPDDSPVKLELFEQAPDLAVTAPVARRAGCDPNPIDPTSEEGRLTLSSYVWPDQQERWERLRGALAVAAKVPAPVEKIGAGAFLERELADLPEGRATVVFHSVVLQYIAPDERDAVLQTIADAGARAGDRSPFAWLRLEPPEDPEQDRRLAEVRLTMWPGGIERLIARAGYHGAPVIWLI